VTKIYMKSVTGIVLALTLLNVETFAGSFSINENSANDMGRANAGRVSFIGDASVAFGNPALMTKMETLTVTNVLSHISGASEFTNTGSIDLLGAPLNGNADGFFDSAFVPAFHAVYPLNDRLAIGVSVNAPYGLSSTYEVDWPGRYQALESSLLTFNVNPSVAYALNDYVSIGGGVSIQYAIAELSSSIDFGAVCFAGLGPQSCTTLGLTPQSADGELALEGNDISFGYNFALAFTPSDNIIFGATYRSGVSHRLSGDADIEVPNRAMPLTAQGAFLDTDFKADLPLPAVLEFGVTWQATPKFILSANINQTQWSKLDTLDVEFENPAQPETGEELNYKNAKRYNFGVDYKLSESLTLRGGYGFDESPSRPDFRSARIPDNDRNIYAIGASYNGWESWQIDVAYNRFDVKDTAFDRTGPVNDRLRGDVKLAIDILSASVTKRF